MATEKFANSAVTTLNGGIDDSTTSVVVASATHFSSSSQYRILIDSELMIVTAGAGTTTWTVTRGAESTTATPHINGSQVTQVITAGAITQAFADTAVTLAGENYLTLGGQQITANAVNLSGSNVTGTLASGRFPALTGDATTSAGSLATTIANNAVSYAKMQDVSATSRVLGRKTGGSGDPEECTLSDVLDFIGSAAQGDILYRGSSTWSRLGAGTSGNFLQTQGTGANPQWADASTSALPSQTGNSGKFLTTNGTAASWGVDGSSLTTLNASNISSGTLSNSRLSGVALTASANAFTVGGQTITIATTSDVGLSIIGASGQSGDLLRLRTNGPTTAVAFDSSGYGFPVPVTFGLIGVQTTGTSKTNQLIIPFAGKIVKAWISAKTGPTSADFIVDINLNGTSIWNSTQANRVKIVAAATTGNQTSFDTTAVSAGDLVTIDVDQIGSGTAGSDVTVVLTILTKNN